MQLIKEFEYTLSSPIKYQFNGEHLETNILYLKAPADVHRKIAPKIAQNVMRAFMAQNENFETKKKDGKKGKKDEEEIQEKKEGEITKEVIIMLLYSSRVIDIVEFKEEFRELLLSAGICSLNNNVYLSTGHLQQIDQREIDDLMGDYISNFLLPSVLTQKKKS
jgi:hypothetical protein